MVQKQSQTQDWFKYPINPDNDYATEWKFDTHGNYIWDTPHFAADVETPFHTPITSLFSGTVTVADYKPWGGQVIIKTRDVEPINRTIGKGAQNPVNFGIYHLDELDVKPGDYVQQGDVLGLSGGQTSGGNHPVQCNKSACYSSGVHTHAFLQDPNFSGKTPPKGNYPVTNGIATVPLYGKSGTYSLSYGTDITPFIQDTATYGYSNPVQNVKRDVSTFFDPSAWYASILKSLGITNTKDLLYRLGFLGLGTLLIIVGVVMLAKSVSSGVVQGAVQAAT